MTGDAELVARVKQALISEQQIPVQQSTHEHALLITAHVAAATGGRLVVKTSGDYARVNGILYSSDGINFEDGYVDCLKDAGPPANENRPVWQVKAHAANFDRSQLTDPRTAPQPVIRALTPAAPIEPPAPGEPPDGPADDEQSDDDPTLIETLTALAVQFRAIPPALKAQADILETMATAITQIRERQEDGLTGALAYRMTLKPPPKPKANGAEKT